MGKRYSRLSLQYQCERYDPGFPRCTKGDGRAAKRVPSAWKAVIWSLITPRPDRGADAQRLLSGWRTRAASCAWAVARGDPRGITRVGGSSSPDDPR
jgi:hypothetical protein